MGFFLLSGNESNQKWLSPDENNYIIDNIGIRPEPKKERPSACALLSIQHP